MDIHSTMDYEEMEKRIPTQVKQIRTVLKEKYEISIPCHCDEFIARCVRQKDGSVENAIKLIRSYQVAIEGFKQWDVAMQPSLAMEAQKNGLIVPLKTRDSNGRYIIIARVGSWDPEQINFEQGMAFLWMITQYMATAMIDVQRHGFVTVWDFRGFSLKHGWAIKHRKFISLLKWGHNGVAGRLKELHAIHHPKIADIIWKAVTPFLKEKQRNRIMIHGSVDSLLERVGAAYLPTFLGGAQDPEECLDKARIEEFYNSDQFYRDMLKDGFPSL